MYLCTVFSVTTRINMANSYFQFKQFTVWHDRCAMKVGTDAVLLGSWMRVDGARRLLDIGCGCGLIALMAAQRCQGQIVAVEIDAEAARQASENVSASPWASRIDVVNQDICSFDGGPFDVIFSNPPYFVDSLKSPDVRRTSARHTDTLTFGQLMGRVSSLLSPHGEFSLVIPMNVADLLKAEALSRRLFLSRETHVQAKLGATPKRVLMAFRKELPEEHVVPQHLVMHTASGSLTEEYGSMVNDFYL